MSTEMPKVFIFGAGSVGKYVLLCTQGKYQVIGILDNDENKCGQHFEGLPVYKPTVVSEMSYDMVIIASNAGSVSMTAQLLDLGVKRSSICTEYVDFTVRSRIVFLEKLSELFSEEKIHGCMAECGVFQGEFAMEINRVFPKNKLYLFDTFTGFDANDVEIEKQRKYSEFETGHFRITDENTVRDKLPHPELCYIRKGHFPGTTEGLDELFCFVNLDFDLYKPTLAGLEYFVPRMVKGGIILIHDYFSLAFKGIKAAVKEFESKSGKLRLIPIGDALSAAIHF